MTNDLFFDTDCLSAFLWINNTNILQELYTGKIVLPESVYQELSNPCIPHLKQRVDILIANHVAKVQEIKADTVEYKLFMTLVNGEKGWKSIGHILLEALEKDIIAEDDGNDIWQQMLARRRKLPTNSFTEYINGIKSIV